MIMTKTIMHATRGETDIIDITPDLRNALASIKMKNGIVTVFVPGATGGLTTVEYEPGVVKDVKDAFERLAARNAEYAHNVKWGDGNGYAHVRAALLGPSITIPFNDGKLILGQWQQVILVDFDNRPRTREIVTQFMGEK